MRINLPLADYEAEESIFFLLWNSALFQVTWNREFIWRLLYVCVKEGVLGKTNIVLSILIVKSEGLTN